MLINSISFMFRSIITGTGSYIPPVIQTNNDFAKHVFYSGDQQPLATPPEEVVEKFKEITGIEERRYTTDDLNTSDIGANAALKAIIDSGVNPEELDQLIVAHNFGNVSRNTIQTVAVPSLACVIKNRLGIRNPALRRLRYFIWLPGMGAGCYTG